MSNQTVNKSLSLLGLKHANHPSHYEWIQKIQAILRALIKYLLDLTLSPSQQWTDTVKQYFSQDDLNLLTTDNYAEPKKLYFWTPVLIWYHILLQTLTNIVCIVNGFTRDSKFSTAEKVLTYK